MRTISGWQMSFAPSKTTVRARARPRELSRLRSILSGANYQNSGFQFNDMCKMSLDVRSIKSRNIIPTR